MYVIEKESLIFKKVLKALLTMYTKKNVINNLYGMVYYKNMRDTLFIRTHTMNRRGD